MEFALRHAAPRGCVQQLYFNASGAGSEGEIGEAHNPETHLVPFAVDAALGLGPPLTLLVDDYPTPDGSCIRDFRHVSDLAEGPYLRPEMAAAVSSEEARRIVRPWQRLWLQRTARFGGDGTHSWTGA